MLTLGVSATTTSTRGSDTWYSQEPCASAEAVTGSSTAGELTVTDKGGDAITGYIFDLRGKKRGAGAGSLRARLGLVFVFAAAAAMLWEYRCTGTAGDAASGIGRGCEASRACDAIGSAWYLEGLAALLDMLMKSSPLLPAAAMTMNCSGCV